MVVESLITLSAFESHLTVCWGLQNCVRELLQSKKKEKKKGIFHSRTSTHLIWHVRNFQN